MNRRLARALVALAVPALAVPALTTPAVAAAKGPAVPTIEEVAEIYPHLEGGTAEIETDPVPRIEDDCSNGKPYAGSRLRSAFYDEADPSYHWTAKKPLVSASAMSFRKVGQATEFLGDFATAATTTACFGGDVDSEVTVTTKKIRFALGDERVGLTVTVKMMGQKSVFHVLLARQGKVVAVTTAMSSPAASPVKKAVRLERLVLRTASR